MATVLESHSWNVILGRPSQAHRTLFHCPNGPKVIPLSSPGEIWLGYQEEFLLGKNDEALEQIAQGVIVSGGVQEKGRCSIEQHGLEGMVVMG